MTPQRLHILKLASYAGIVCVAIALFFVKYIPALILLRGIWYMTFGFIGGLAIIRLILGYSHPITGVARTLVDEAIRMKVALIFMIGLIFLIPVLPISLSPAERLEYRIQTFLTYSTSGMSLLLSLMTIFLACGTVSAEFQQKQIFLTLTKPVSRASYLAGKFLGIALLNLLLISVSGLVIYDFARMLEQLPAKEAWDRNAVEQQVLVSRETLAPIMMPGDNRDELIVERFKMLYGEDPLRWADTTALDLNKPDVLNNAIKKLRPSLRRELESAVDARWMSIGAGMRKTYRFTGLQDAGRYTDQIQLRFKPEVHPQPEDKRVLISFLLNGRPFLPVPEKAIGYATIVTVSEYSVFPVPVMAINKDGILDITLGNENDGDAKRDIGINITFNPKKGLEVLYRVGTFESNLACTLLILWLRLIFLGMLGLAASTFLGFPVACLFSLLVYVTAISSGFLHESLEYFAAVAPDNFTVWQQITWTFGHFFTQLMSGNVWDALKLPIRLFGSIIVLLVPDFSRFNPVPLMADGRVIPTAMLGDAVLWLVLIWTSAFGIVGWLIFRKREIARVTV